MSLASRIIEEASEILSDCERVLGTARHVNATAFVDEGMFAEVLTKSSFLLRKLGPFQNDISLAGLTKKPSSVEKLMGIFRAVKTSAEKGRLATAEELISGEVLGDLLEQAQELLEKHYYLACCVILRAVLEERLRKLAATHDCSPQGPRPGIEDYNQALYAANRADANKGYGKATMQWVTSMAGIGNDAAHNKREIGKEDAERLMDGLRRFLPQFTA